MSKRSVRKVRHHTTAHTFAQKVYLGGLPSKLKSGELTYDTLPQWVKMSDTKSIARYLPVPAVPLDLDATDETMPESHTHGTNCNHDH